MIYFDANATSRLRPEAVQAIQEMLAETATWSNPSSVHAPGRKARNLLSDARLKVNLLLAGRGQTIADRGTERPSIFFTAGGTESCNTLVHGYLAPLIGSSGDGQGGHLIATALEHSAMLQSMRHWAARGFELSLVKTELAASGGLMAFVSPQQIVNTLRDDTKLVSVMAANNETGALQPVREIALALRSAGYRGAIISDITQALGKSSCDVYELFRSGVDGVAISGHKLGAPAGVGFFALRACSFGGRGGATCLAFAPLMLGGEQENGMRSGTENLIGIVALGAVCEGLSARLPDELARRRRLRDLLYSNLIAAFPDCQTLTPLGDHGAAFENGAALVNTLLVRFPGCRADDLVVALDLEGVAVSAGSACHSGKQNVSHVLRAMQVEDHAAREYLRISLDWDATDESVNEGSARFSRVVSRMRE